jgi:hypothetical protein
MVNHGSLFCSSMRPIYVDLSQLRHLRHVIYVIYVSVFNFTSPLRGCGAARRGYFYDKMTFLILLDMYFMICDIFCQNFVKIKRKLDVN